MKKLLAILILTACTAPVNTRKPKNPAESTANPIQVEANEDVTDMLIWICFNRSDGTDAALEACGAEY